jgi:AcrR family transcriptional regulator
MKDTRERIISVAYNLFSEKGYNATLDEIAKAVGFRTPSIYSHFECKEELFLVVISQEIGDFFRGFEIELENIAGRSIDLAPENWTSYNVRKERKKD